MKTNNTLTTQPNQTESNLQPTEYIPMLAGLIIITILLTYAIVSQSNLY